MSGNSLPAFVLLTLDVGLAGFALGVERVEGLLQAFVGGFARVDRASSLDAIQSSVALFGLCRRRPVLTTWCR